MSHHHVRRSMQDFNSSPSSHASRARRFNHRLFNLQSPTP